MKLAAADLMTAALQRLLAAGLTPQRWSVGDDLCCHLDGAALQLSMSGNCPEDISHNHLFMGVPAVTTGRAGSDWVIDTDAGFSVFGPELALRLVSLGETLVRSAQIVQTVH